MGGRGGSSGSAGSGSGTGNSRNASSQPERRQTLAEINAESQRYFNQRSDQYNHVHDQGTTAQLETYREVEYLLGRSSDAENRGNRAYARQLMRQAKTKYESLPANLRLMNWDEF